MAAHATASTPARSSTIGFNQILIAIMGLALLVRIGAALYHGNTVDILPGIHDQVSYHGLAQRVVDGHGFSFGEMHWPITPADAPTAHWSFLYTLFLAGIYAIAGVNPLLVRLIQVVVVSLVHTWLVYHLAMQVFGRRTGVWAALLSSVYIYFVYYSGALMTEPFYIIGILWTLDIAVRIAKRVELTLAESGSDQSLDQNLGISWRQWLELGVAIGFTMLMRQVFGLFVPLLFVWLWWTISASVRLAMRRTPQPEGTLASAIGPRWLGIYFPPVWGMMLASVIALLLIAPWTVRNYQAFGQFVPLNTNSGYAFFWGNHPIYGTDFVGILPSDGPTYQELIPEELRHLNEAELDKALLQRGLGFVTDDPVRYFWLSLSRSREYFKFWPSAESSLVSNIARVGSFGLLLPFMIYGIVLTVMQWLRKIRDRADTLQMPWWSGVTFLAGFAIFYTTIHLMTWALIRYRLPVDGLLLIWAGYAFSHIQGWLSARRAES